jgi:hypothetical protein
MIMPMIMPMIPAAYLNSRPLWVKEMKAGV